MVNGTKIKELMAKKSITNRELAKSVGISEPMMCYVTQELREPTVTVLARIAVKLGCTVDELIKH